MTWQKEIVEKLKRMNWLKQERGSVLVLTVILLPILFAFLGFGYDLGNIYMHKSRLQNVADAAALAGARAYLDSQATENKDGFDGTVDRASGKLREGSPDGDAYRGGRSTPDVYNVRDTESQRTKNRDYSKHIAADRAADAYIYHNINNLGTEVKTDKWSHYAVNSDGTNPKTFYRVGLYEKVPLYFLPIIKSVKSPQIVRAGAIALVVPGTTTTDSGTGGSPGVSFSIFDNLFTYRDSFDNKHASKLNDPKDPNYGIYAKYEGAIVYTHGDDHNEFYSEVDTNTSPHLYNGRGSSTVGIPINDPTIDTVFRVDDYVEALTTAKLCQKYCVISDQNIKSLKVTDINNPNSFLYNTKYFMKDFTGGKALVAEQPPADIIYSGEVDENWRQISYVKVKTSQNSTEYIYVPCIKNQWNDPYYLINKDKKKLDIQLESVNGNYFMKLNGQDVYFDKNDYKFKTGNGAVINEKIAALSTNYEQFKYSNIFYINNRNNVNIYIDAELVGQDGGGVNTPIYIIVDPTMQRINIFVTHSNVRPIVFVDTGTDQVQFNNSEKNATFSGVLYTPYMEGKGIQLKSKGGFKGNIISKSIDIEDEDQSLESQIEWIQKNYLENKEYIDADVAKVTESIKNSHVNYSYDSLSDDIKADILTTLGITADKLGNMQWYQDLSFSEKQSFYGKWKQLYNRYKDNIAARNVLWPWNEHFNIDQGGGQTITTDETLRLINFRTDYQEKNPDGSVNNGEKDPFIYLSLDEEDAY